MKTYIKKSFFIILFLILLTIFLSGCSIIPSTKILSADITITSWEQDYCEYSKEWNNYVCVYYKIENTGNVDIKYYKIWFTATCIDEKIYGLLKIGQSINIEQYKSDYIFIYVPNEQVISVEIIRLELGH